MFLTDLWGYFLLLVLYSVLLASHSRLHVSHWRKYHSLYSPFSPFSRHFYTTVETNILARSFVSRGVWFRLDLYRIWTNMTNLWLFKYHFSVNFSPMSQNNLKNNPHLSHLILNWPKWGSNLRPLFVSIIFISVRKRRCKGNISVSNLLKLIALFWVFSPANELAENWVEHLDTVRGLLV